MGGYSSSKSTQRMESGPYENNVRISNPQVSGLLSGLTSKLGSSLMNNSSGDALTQNSQRTLQKLQNNTYAYQPNAYTRQALDSLAAKNYNQFQEDFAKAYSNVQGLGQGATTASLGNVYSDYKYNTDLARAQLMNDQYNKDMSNILAASEAGLGQDNLTQLSSLALSLGDLFKETYGYQPVVLTDSKSKGFSIG